MGWRPIRIAPTADDRCQRRNKRLAGLVFGRQAKAPEKRSGGIE